MNWVDPSLVVLAYLVGAIPFGMLVAKALGGADLRSRGSGNIGATNVARVLGRRAGAVTLAGDLLKGALPVWLAARMGGDGLALWAAGAAVGGHMFPVYLGFKGGKGVATGFGVLMVLSPFTCLAALALWIGAARGSRISAVGALAAYGALPLLAWGLGPGHGFVPFCVALSGVVIVRHHQNIRQLLAGRV